MKILGRFSRGLCKECILRAVNLPLKRKALPDPPAVSRFPELRHGPDKICGSFCFFLSDLQSSGMGASVGRNYKKIKLVRFAHNWPPARRACAPEGILGYWKNGKLGYCKIPIDSELNRGISFFLKHHSIIPSFHVRVKNISLKDHLYFQ